MTDPRVPPQPASILRVVLLWAPAIALMSAIYYFSSMSSPPDPAGVSDKTLHTGAFGVLALLLLRGLAGGAWKGVTWRTLVGCCVITVLFGIAIEWRQMYIPDRTSELLDVAADLGGAVVAASAAGAWSIIRRL